MAQLRPFRLLVVRAPEDASAVADLRKHLALDVRRERLDLIDLALLADPAQVTPDYLTTIIAHTDAALFVLSPNFLISPLCLDFLDLASANETYTRLPLWYSSCHLEDLDTLARLQPLPRERRFVSEFAQRDQIWMSVARDISHLVKQKSSQLSPLPAITPMHMKQQHSTTADPALWARQQLASNDIATVLDQLLADSPVKTEENTELILLKGQYQQLDFQQRNGLITASDANVALANIRHTLISLIGRVYE